MKQTSTTLNPKKKPIAGMAPNVSGPVIRKSSKAAELNLSFAVERQKAQNEMTNFNAFNVSSEKKPLVAHFRKYSHSPQKKTPTEKKGHARKG